jgi:hypothetical protein
LRELFGAEPCLILLDELASLRKVATGSQATFAAEQLTAFLTALFKAVESTPKAALVFTLALGRTASPPTPRRKARPSQVSWRKRASVSARKAALLDPTEEDETVKVLCRRLFAAIDLDKAKPLLPPTNNYGMPTGNLCPRRRCMTTGGRIPRRLSAAPGTDRHPPPTRPRRLATSSEYGACCGFSRARSPKSGANRPVDAFAIQLQHIDLQQPIRQRSLPPRSTSATPAIKAEVAAHAA